MWYLDVYILRTMSMIYHRRNAMISSDNCTSAVVLFEPRRLIDNVLVYGDISPQYIGLLSTIFIDIIIMFLLVFLGRTFFIVS